ncbi:NYN domain-containing protein [Micrococcaceae bacterium Sec5.7]
MSRKSVIFVDAGFLLATGGLRVTGNSLRSAFTVQYKSLADGIQSFVRKRDDRDLLRTYWYDAAKDGLFSDEHKRIGLLPGVKVRLGRMSYNGEQKGVDLKLGLDLVGVARNRSADVAYLLSGDDDLAEAVEAAQDLGMKVVLLGIENQGHRLGVTAVAEHLALQVDDIATLPQSLLDGCFAKSGQLSDPAPATTAPNVLLPVSSADGHTRPVPSPGPRRAIQVARPHPAVRREPVYSTESGAAPTPSPWFDLVESAEQVAVSLANNWHGSVTQLEINELLAERPLLPPDIDRVLIKDCAAKIGETKTDIQDIRKALRATFWRRLDELV